MELVGAHQTIATVAQIKVTFLLENDRKLWEERGESVGWFVVVLFLNRF